MDSYLLNDDLHGIELPCRRTGKTRVAFRDRKNDIHALNDFAENGMVTVQPRRRNMRDKELGTIGVGTGICHGKDPGFVVL